MENKQDFGKQPFNRWLRIVMLCIFCAAGTALCIWLTADAITRKRPGVMSVSPIQLPAHIGQHEDSAAIKAREKGMQRLHRAVIYLDSLARSPNRAFYDSVMAAHPGLADTLAKMQSHYPELFTNKNAYNDTNTEP